MTKTSGKTLRFWQVFGNGLFTVCPVFLALKAVQAFGHLFRLRRWDGPQLALQLNLVGLATFAHRRIDARAVLRIQLLLRPR